MRRREGPHRFTQNRPRTFAVALRSVAAAEKSKNQLSRDFRCRPICNLFNSIGTKRTSDNVRYLVANTGKADMTGEACIGSD
jgi:hypothetical protein